MSQLDRFKELIDSHDSFIISTHAFPDADGIGSQIALCLGLKKRGKKAICCNDQPLLERYHYLDQKKTIKSIQELNRSDYGENPLIIVVDTNTINRTGRGFSAFALKTSAPIFYIDHHPATFDITENHYIETKAAATGQLTGEILQALEIPIDKVMALALYTAILIDTSSFRYPTVSSRTHKLISDLLKTGIQPSLAYNGIYGTKKVQHMHYLGEVLKTANANASEEIAWLVLHEHKMDQFETDIEDTHAFVNHLLILDNIKVAIMFREEGPYVKASLRSSGDYDVGVIAIGLGGGGHSHSAATLIEKGDMSVDEIIADMVRKVEELISE